MLNHGLVFMHRVLLVLLKMVKSKEIEFSCFPDVLDAMFFGPKFVCVIECWCGFMFNVYLV